MCVCVFFLCPLFLLEEGNMAKFALLMGLAQAVTEVELTRSSQAGIPAPFNPDGVKGRCGL